MSKGVYCLVMRSDGEFDIDVGRLGRFHFNRGIYIYTGRSLISVEKRIARHLTKVNGDARRPLAAEVLLRRAGGVWDEDVNVIGDREEKFMKTGKKLHWHIDYLLEHINVINAITFGLDEFSECALNMRISRIEGANPPARGFGSSDCKCYAHLWWFKDIPVIE